MPIKKKVHKTAAILTLNEPGKYSPEGRKEIAEWLRRAAKDLVKLGDKYTEKKFVARYFY